MGMDMDPARTAPEERASGDYPGRTHLQLDPCGVSQVGRVEVADEQGEVLVADVSAGVPRACAGTHRQQYADPNRVVTHLWSDPESGSVVCMTAWGRRQPASAVQGGNVTAATSGS